VTTHTEVGTFVQKVLGEKLEARRALITNAIAEAANRERVRETLTVPVDIDDSHSLSEGIVAMPPGLTSTPRLEATGSHPRADGSFPRGDASAPGPGTWPTHPGDGSTGGTFVAPQVDFRPARKWPIAAAAAAMAVLALVGGVLILFSVRGRALSTAQAAENARKVANATTIVAPPAATPAESVTAEPPPEEKKETLSPAVSASASAAPKATPAWQAWTPPPPAKSAKPKQKKRDDEAGF
jgi:hypothetical protein